MTDVRDGRIARFFKEELGVGLKRSVYFIVTRV